MVVETELGLIIVGVGFIAHRVALILNSLNEYPSLAKEAETHTPPQALPLYAELQGLVDDLPVKAPLTEDELRFMNGAAHRFRADTERIGNITYRVGSPDHERAKQCR